MEKIQVNSSRSTGRKSAHNKLWNFSISCLESIKLFFGWKEVLSLFLADKFWKTSCCLYKFLVSLRRHKNRNTNIHLQRIQFFWTCFAYAQDQILLWYSIPVSPRYKSVREQRPRCKCFMTDFHKLFIVKLNKIIHKKTRASFLVAYVIYVSLVYTDSKKTASCLLPGLLPRLSTWNHLCNF